MAEGNSTQAAWYVVHTYSGYENKVKTNIEKTVTNRNMEDQIFEVAVPVEEVEEEKNGKLAKVQRKVFPGYVLVNMLMNDETWYVVRNTRGVTGFVGPGSKPIPLSEEEVANLGHLQPTSEFEVGDTVMIREGGFEGQIVKISAVDLEKREVHATALVMGLDSDIELRFSQIEKM